MFGSDKHDLERAIWRVLRHGLPSGYGLAVLTPIRAGLRRWPEVYVGLDVGERWRLDELLSLLPADGNSVSLRDVALWAREGG